MKLPFTKMQGCANDYIYLDCREGGVPEQIRRAVLPAVPAAFFHWCGRHHLHLRPGDAWCPWSDADVQRRRQRGKMCGNGIRCCGPVAAHPCAGMRCWMNCASIPAADSRPCAGRGGMWQVEMGQYSLLPADLPAVQMGKRSWWMSPLSAAGRTWQVSCVSVGKPPLCYHRAGCGRLGPGKAGSCV